MQRLMPSAVRLQLVAAALMLPLVVVAGCSADARIVSGDSRSPSFVVCSNGRGGKAPLDDVAIRACPAPSFLHRLRCGSQVEENGPATMTASPGPDSASRPIDGPCCEYRCILAIP